MKYIKIFLFIACNLMIIFSIQTAEESLDPNLETVLESLKHKFFVVKNKKYTEGMPLPTKEDFKEIRDSLLEHPFKLPQPLETFYLEAGNLSFTHFHLARAHGGKGSQLYKLIREGHENGLPLNQLLFCEVEGNEGFCMDLATEKIQRFTFRPALQTHESYDTLAAWIKRWWLTSS